MIQALPVVRFLHLREIKKGIPEALSMRRLLQECLRLVGLLPTRQGGSPLMGKPLPGSFQKTCTRLLANAIEGVPKVVPVLKAPEESSDAWSEIGTKGYFFRTQSKIFCKVVYRTIPNSFSNSTMIWLGLISSP